MACPWPNPELSRRPPRGGTSAPPPRGGAGGPEAVDAAERAERMRVEARSGVAKAPAAGVRAEAL